METKERQEEDQINALIIVPTRELAAVQIVQNLEAFAYFTPISSIAIWRQR